MENNFSRLVLATISTALSASVDITLFSVQAQTVVPPDFEFAGQTLYEWSADWWKTFLEAPSEGNPLVSEDPNGMALEAINDSSSPVFFLTGRLDNIPVNRTVTVSNRQGIFFPIINEGFIATDETVEEACNATVTNANAIDVNSLFATLDGQNIDDLGSQRQSCGDEPNQGGFFVEAPEGSLLNSFGLDPDSYLFTSDGYWLMLTPLSLGEHTLTFGGMSSGNQQNQIYTINVVNVPEPISILGILALGTLGIGSTLKKKLK